MYPSPIIFLHFNLVIVFVYFRLTFEFDPSSRVHNFHSHPLKPGGEQEDVTMDNVEEYIDLVLDFCFVSGIRRQMEAFRSELSASYALYICLSHFWISWKKKQIELLFLANCLSNDIFK